MSEYHRNIFVFLRACFFHLRKNLSNLNQGNCAWQKENFSCKLVLLSTPTPSAQNCYQHFLIRQSPEQQISTSCGPAGWTSLSFFQLLRQSLSLRRSLLDNWRTGTGCFQFRCIGATGSRAKHRHKAGMAAEEFQLPAMNMSDTLAEEEPRTEPPPMWAPHAEGSSLALCPPSSSVAMQAETALVPFPGDMAGEEAVVVTKGMQGSGSCEIGVRHPDCFYRPSEMCGREVVPRTRKLPEGQYWIPKPEQLVCNATEFACPICNQIFVRQNNLRMHMWVHGPEYRGGAESLRLTDPSKQAQLPCYCPHPGCTKSFDHRMGKPLKDLKTLQTHYKRKHGDKPFPCTKCGKRFAVKGDWQSHEKVCGKNWFCFCGEDFKSKYWLQDHITQKGGTSTGHGIAQFSAESSDVAYGIVGCTDELGCKE